LHRFDRHRLVAVFEPAVALAVAECVTSDEHTDGGAAQTDEGGGRGVSRDTQQLEEPVGCELLSGSGVFGDASGALLLGRALRRGEAWSAASRRGELVVGFGDLHECFWV